MSGLLSLERLERRSRRSQYSRRFREIVSVAAKYGLADQLQKLPGKRIAKSLRRPDGQNITELPVPVRIRLALTELGTTFIKFGQMLSTRADLVGEDVARELTHLQSNAPPEAPGVAERTIEAELGAAPDTLFGSFDATPFASASIAQVHRARLRSGESVVVKIQRDGIAKTIEADLGILQDLATLVERYSEELRAYHPTAVVRQFTRTMRGELDFRRELRNLELFRKNFAGDPTVHFPVPYPELSTGRVLTMERLEGVLVSRIKLLPGDNPDLDEFTRRGANMYLEMIFRDAFYHADPHPGNLMILPDNVVGVLDCGMVEHLDDELRESIEDLLLAAVHGDARTVTDAVWNLSTSPPISGRQRLHGDIVDLVGEYAGQTLGGVNVGHLVSSLTGVIHENRLFLPPGAMLLLRMLGELEGTAKQVNPSFGLWALVKPYAEEAARRRFMPTRVLAQVQRGVAQWSRLAQTLPSDLNDMMQEIRAGTFSVHLEHRRLEPVVNRLVLGVLAASLLLGSSMLWSFQAQPLVRGVSLFGAIGYILASLLALKLLRAIRRSERSPVDT